MHSNNCLQILVLAAAFVMLMTVAPVAGADNFTKAGRSSNIEDPLPEPPSLNPENKATYNGRLRVYIVEPDSRWQNLELHQPWYHNGFLDYGLDEVIAVPDAGQIEYDMIWDASENGWSGVTESNVMAIAVIFDDDWFWGYSSPPSGYPFQAYYTDAAAAARPGETGSNIAVGDFTHSVFVEEGTATWCKYCAYVVDALHDIETSGDYPFHYVALVLDSCSAAADRLEFDFNYEGLPTAYFDGGFLVLQGGWDGMEGDLRTYIEASGERSVPGLLLNIETDFLGNDTVKAHITISQGDPTNQAPNSPSSPAGPDTVMLGVSYGYNCTPVDPEGQDVYCKFGFDSDSTGWTGPYSSGEVVEVDHSFGTSGTHTVRVRVKDKWGAETNWSPVFETHAYICGDANASGFFDIDDIIYVIGYIFAEGGEPDPFATGDANCSGHVDIDDVIFMIGYVFAGGPAPCGTCP